MKEDEEKEDINQETFQVIENKFRRIVDQCKTEQNFSSLCKEFEELFLDFKKCYTKKEQVAFSIERELKQDAENAWNLVEAGKKKETAISNSVSQLQDQVIKLANQLEEERINYSRQSEQQKKAIEDCDFLKTRATELSEKLNNVEKKVDDLEHRNAILEEKNKDLRQKNAKLHDELSNGENKARDEKKKNDQLEADMLELHTKLDFKIKESIDLQQSSALAKIKVESLNKSLRDAQQRLETQVSASVELTEKAQILTDNLKTQKNQLDSVRGDLHETSKKLEIAKFANQKMEAEKAQIQRKYDHEHKNLLRLQQSIDNMKSAHASSQQEIQTLHKNLDKVKDNENEVMRQNRLLEREKNIHVDKIQRMEQTVRQAEEDAWHQEQTILSLEKDLIVSKNDTSELQKKLKCLDQLCDKHNSDIKEQGNKLEEANDKVHSRDIEIKEMKKDIVQWKTKCDDQEQLANRLRAEKGRALREVIDKKNEIQIVKNQNNIITLEIENLRNELLLKDETLVKSHFDRKKETTKSDQLSNEVSVLKRQMINRDDIIQKQEIEMNRMNATIKQMDEDILRHKKEYGQLVNERDILSAQLIRRNDELALLYEKLKIQMITLSKGEIQYKERIDDLRHLTIKFQDAKRELNVAKNGTTDQSGLSQELIRREKELLHEKVKVKALSEELQNPLNIHRWRKLEGSDPAKFELVQKNELLHKRLITKTEEVSFLSVDIISVQCIHYLFCLYHLLIFSPCVHRLLKRKP